MNNKLKVLFVSSEVHPYAKTGGLADVAFALPKALKQSGVDVRIAMPCYQKIDRSKFDLSYLTDFPVKINDMKHNCIVRESKLDIIINKSNDIDEQSADRKKTRKKHDSVPVYFIDSYEFFDRAGYYGEGSDYEDNAKRFSYFCRSVLEMLKKIDFKPDIIHVNDWQTALIPLLLNNSYKSDEFYSNIATIFTIHNIQYQGVFDIKALVDLDLTWDYYSPDLLEYYGKINLMKAGIIFSDIVNTVSNTYSVEIQNSPLGMGLEGLLATRKNDIYAVINGVDYDEWNPENDKSLAANYNAKTIKKKAECKADLQKACGLPVSEVPVIGIVSRLADQKGFDIVEKAMNDIMKLDLQLVVLGTGDKRYVDMFKEFGEKYPQKCSVFLKFDGFVASKIYAGSDIFLMPSRFEPCGMGQLIALKYGTVPLVRATGGLIDTILNFDARTMYGNGFSFTEYNDAALLRCIEHALSIYQNKQIWNVLVQNTMASNYSWDVAAEKYYELYMKAVDKRK
ncbi:MAG: glycogen/starch synthase [Candidatus Wallbacteria bacterium]